MAGINGSDDSVSVEILHAAGITNRSRIKEVENSVFYREFVKRLSNERRTMFLLTETESVLEASRQYIEQYASGIQVVGTYAFENLTGDADSIINDINGAARTLYCRDYHLRSRSSLYLRIKTRSMPRSGWH